MKSPLKPARTDFSFKSSVFDFKAIREKAAPNPFGIRPDPPPAKLTPCSQSDCTAVFDSSKGVWSDGCKGYCYME